MSAILWNDPQTITNQYPVTLTHCYLTSTYGSEFLYFRLFREWNVVQLALNHYHRHVYIPLLRPWEPVVVIHVHFQSYHRCHWHAALLPCSVPYWWLTPSIYFSVEVCLVGVFPHAVSTWWDPFVRVCARLTLASPLTRKQNRTGGDPALHLNHAGGIWTGALVCLHFG